MSAQDLFNAYEDDMPPNFVPVPVLPSISNIRKSSSKEDDATLSLIASERRKKHLPSTIKLLNDTERVIARKRSLIEFINMEDETPITADYSPNYYTARPIIIPSSQATAMQNLLTRIKQEPDTSLDSPESNRWWDAHKNNSENPDLNANASSSDPTANNLARLTLPDDRTPGHKDPNKSVSFLLPTPPKKKKARSKKRKISPEFIDTSRSDSTSDPDNDSEPQRANNLFKVFFLDKERKKAVVNELSSLHPETGGIVFSDQLNDSARQARSDLVSRVKDLLNESSLEESSFSFRFYKCFTENQEAFFHNLRLIKALMDKGIFDPQKIQSMIGFSEDAQKNVIFDPDENDHVPLAPEDQNLISSFDIRDPDDRLPATSCSSSHPPCFSGNSGSVAGPTSSSTPTQRDDANNPARFNFPQNISAITPPCLDPNSPTFSEDFIKETTSLSIPFEKLIQNFPVLRQKITYWTNAINNGDISPPTPSTYSSLGSNALSDSFRGEPLPGVFLPSGSKFSLNEACNDFIKNNGRNPKSIIEINEYLFSKYPPPMIPFDPAVHCLDLPPYSMRFFRQAHSLHLNKKGVPGNSGLEHTPFNLSMARQFFNLSHDCLLPLEPFTCDPLLTTLGPGIEHRYKFKGFSVDLHDGSGSIVMHRSMFNHTSTSYPLISKSSFISQCAYCKGLHALPGHAVMLGYFWPKGMNPRFITPPIKLIWTKQQIPVCWIHVATEGYYEKSRDISI